jgi:hypothetical protein
VSFLVAQLEWLKSILSEPDGKGSFRRVGSFLVIGHFIKYYGTIAGATKALPEIPETWVIIILTLLGFSSILTMVMGYFDTRRVTAPATNNNVIVNPPASQVNAEEVAP